MLVKALQDAGNRQWFTIVERERLENLLNERQIIREMRKRNLDEPGVNPQALPALLFAGVLLEGGVVGYDTNAVTGGPARRFSASAARPNTGRIRSPCTCAPFQSERARCSTSVTASKTMASQSIGRRARSAM